ncbi:hypothetical protein MUP32_05670 [Candidatus Microgenomates bacterium]|nr:hypothetical protein [Candidatus Microgenomates bacterium]
MQKRTFVLVCVIVGSLLLCGACAFAVFGSAAGYTAWQTALHGPRVIVEKPPVVVEPKPPVVVEPKPPVVVNPRDSQGTFTAAQLNAVLGVNNWTCFYDRTDAVAVKNWPAGQIVAFPLSAVDKGVKYTLGQAVPGTGAATAWLGGVLPVDQCPSASSVAPIVPPTASAVDCNISRFGAIQRFPDRDDAVQLNASAPFTAPLGWTFDRQGVKYQPGNTVPAGSITAWAPQECKGQIK